MSNPEKSPPLQLRLLKAIWAGIVYAYPLIIVAVLWEAAARLELVRPLFLPAVSTIVEQIWPLVRSGQVIDPLFSSLYRAFGGLLLALLIGVPAGLMMARLRWFNWLLNPLVSVGFPAPKIAFVPLFVFWFGIDHLSKILLVAFTCVFPLIIATYHGATAVNRTVIWSALAMGTSERKMLSKIIFPATLPYIAAGIQVVTPLALLTAFTAEMVAGGGGVGAEVMFAQRFYRTPEVFVYILIMLVSGVLLDRLMLHLNRRAMPWQEPQQTH